MSTPSKDSLAVSTRDGHFGALGTNILIRSKKALTMNPYKSSCGADLCAKRKNKLTVRESSMFTPTGE